MFPRSKYNNPIHSENRWECEFCGAEYPSERQRDMHMDSCSYKPITASNSFQRFRPERSSTLRKHRLLFENTSPTEEYISFQGKLNNPMETTIIWKEEIPIFREVLYVDSIQGPAKLTWKEERKLYQGKAPLSLGEHTGSIVLSTTGITMPVQPFEVKKEGTGMSIVMLRLAYTKSSGETEPPTIPANTAALEPETGTELCRVKLEGGSLGGYRSDILTENLSERESTMLKCQRCHGIMKDASIGNNGEQLCSCCLLKGKEQSLSNANVRNTILSLKCGCPLSKRGCEWLGRLESVENHMTTCGHVYVSCQLLCGVVTTRDEMGRHVREECSQREEACLHCSGVHKVCEMVEHVKVCGKVEVMCELGCGTRVRRESILCHRERECCEESVVCPYEKYRCEVAGLKRRELKQHLEENRPLHTELKLNALENLFEIVVSSNNSLRKQIEVFEGQMKIKDEEIENLEKLHVKAEGTVEWKISNFSSCFKPSLSPSNPDIFAVAGYNFNLRHWTDGDDFKIDFMLEKGERHFQLEWPMRAIFITRVICHRDIVHSLKMKSPIIEVQKGDYRNYTSHHKQICSIPLSTDLKDFINSNSLDLEITLRILNK